MRLVSRVLLLGVLFVAALLPQQAGAIGLKLAPLEYKSTLKSDEQKKGFIDISNPADVPVKVAVSVQAFRQIDDDGGLQFYEDKQIATAIKPELADFELGPREAIRLFFTIDGKLLPQGDIYAAVFFATEPTKAQNGVGQSVRVGTLLSLVNTAPSPRSAIITGLTIPFFQLSDTVKGEYRIKNTGQKDTGFYPSVKVSSWPTGSSQQREGVLVFGGRERSNEITLKTGYGIHKIEAQYGDSKRSQWVLLVAPWMIVLFLLVALIVAVELVLLKRRRSKKRIKN